MNLSETLALINGRVRSLKAYHLEPEQCSVKINQNENPFDWPKAVKDEIGRFCAERPWNRYPPFVPEALRDALADYAGAPRGGVIVGNGSNEMLLVLLISLVKNGTAVILCQPTFTVYRLLAEGLGAEIVTVPLAASLEYDMPALEEAVKRRPGSVLLLCSPNNPTGTAFSEAEIRKILRYHTGFCILDQAYVEFGGYSAVPLLREFPNLVVTRSFSKAFSGAGLRVGYLLGAQAVVHEFNKMKLPYNINFFSEHTASVLLRNLSVVRERISLITAERDALYACLRSLPFDNVYRSSANFILVRSGRKQALFGFLKKEGILVRDVSSYPMLEGCLRISVGSATENGALKKALQSFFAA
ncbi:MAG: histidinol-phosphate transaminase [Chitinispirillaceae bacterium]|nr:histidinol-phosphate transaminase [Chitinispirillaceae bacterium]